MKKDSSKIIASGLNDLNESYVDAREALKATANSARATKELWRTGKRSLLIKVGVALIAFPDPTISDVVGSALVAAGLIQEGIRRRSLHAEDIAKTFQQTMRELQNLSDCV